MKIERESLPGETSYAIRGYGAGEVLVNDTRHTSSLIVTPNRLDTNWMPGNPDALTPSVLDALLALDPEIILLGTGNRLRQQGMEFQMRALEFGTGLEILDTPSACRTFNILMTEGRRVVAGLIIEQTSG